MILDPAFRAAYDFLELRAKAKEPVQEFFQWWQQYVEADPEKRHAMEHAANKTAIKNAKVVDVSLNLNPRGS